MYFSLIPQNRMLTQQLAAEVPAVAHENGFWAALLKQGPIHELVVNFSSRFSDNRLQPYHATVRVSDHQMCRGLAPALPPDTSAPIGPIRSMQTVWSTLPCFQPPRNLVGSASSLSPADKAHKCLHIPECPSPRYSNNTTQPFACASTSNAGAWPRQSSGSCAPALSAAPAEHRCTATSDLLADRRYLWLGKEPHR